VVFPGRPAPTYEDRLPRAEAIAKARQIRRGPEHDAALEEAESRKSLAALRMDLRFAEGYHFTRTSEMETRNANYQRAADSWAADAKAQHAVVNGEVDNLGKFVSQYPSLVENEDAAAALHARTGGRGSTPWDGCYTDPEHPAGYRVIKTVGVSGMAMVQLQDGPQGEICTLDAAIQEHESAGNVTYTLLIDFSAKGGGVLPAVFTPGKGLAFSDGSAWTQLEPTGHNAPWPDTTVVPLPSESRDSGLAHPGSYDGVHPEFSRHRHEVANAFTTHPLDNIPVHNKELIPPPVGRNRDGLAYPSSYEGVHSTFSRHRHEVANQDAARPLIPLPSESRIFKGLTYP